MMGEHKHNPRAIAAEDGDFASARLMRQIAQDGNRIEALLDGIQNESDLDFILAQVAPSMRAQVEALLREKLVGRGTFAAATVSDSPAPLIRPDNPPVTTSLFRETPHVDEQQVSHDRTEDQHGDGQEGRGRQPEQRPQEVTH